MYLASRVEIYTFVQFSMYLFLSFIFCQYVKKEIFIKKHKIM